MLAKKTTKNQITSPEKVIERFAGVNYLDVSTDGASIILRPPQTTRAEEVRAHLAALQIHENNVKAAAAWARKKG